MMLPKRDSSHNSASKRRGAPRRSPFSCIWLTPVFLEAANALQRANPALRRKISNSLQQHLSDPSHPGLKFERLQVVAERLGSSRVDLRHRLIHQETADNELAVLNVGAHDDMYRWARRYRGVPKQPSGAAVLRFETATAAAREASVPDRLPAYGWPEVDTFAIIEEDELLAAGLPQELVTQIRAAPVYAELFDLPLTEEQRGFVFDCYLRALDRLTPPAPVEAAPLPIPRATSEDALTITSGQQFEAMCDIGLDRYLTALAPEQRRYVDLDSHGILLFKGSAGSGKTWVAVHRLKRHAEQPGLFGERRVLYLCFNRVLAEIVPQMLRTLFGGPPPPTIEVSTLHRWCLRYLRTRGWSIPNLESTDPDGAYTQQFRRLYIERHRAAPEYWERFPLPFVEAEWRQVIVGRHVRSVAEYQALDRAGRGIRLTATDRVRLWELFAAHRALIEEEGMWSFADLAGLALDELAVDPAFVPYDHVIIDEAQDFAAVELRLARVLAGKQEGRLAIFADAAQDIYGRGFRWKDVELSAPRGRQVIELDRNFRNTREIYRAAFAVAAGLEFEDPGDYVIASEPTRHGPRPLLLLARRQPSQPLWSSASVRQ